MFWSCSLLCLLLKFQRICSATAMDSSVCANSIFIIPEEPYYKDSRMKIENFLLSEDLKKLDHNEVIGFVITSFFTALKEQINKQLSSFPKKESLAIEIPNVFAEKVNQLHRECKYQGWCGSKRVSDVIGSLIGIIDFPIPTVSLASLNLLTEIYSDTMNPLISKFEKYQEIPQYYNKTTTSLESIHDPFADLFESVREKSEGTDNELKWVITNPQTVRESMKRLENKICKFHSDSYKLINQMIHILKREDRLTGETRNEMIAAINCHNMLFYFHKMTEVFWSSLYETGMDNSGYDLFYNIQHDFIVSLLFFLVPRDKLDTVFSKSLITDQIIRRESSPLTSSTDPTESGIYNWLVSMPISFYIGALVVSLICLIILIVCCCKDIKKSLKKQKKSRENPLLQATV